MAAPGLAGQGQASGPRLSAPPFWLAATAALLAAVGNGVGLQADGAVYGSGTAALANAATAQDLVSLLVVAPLLVVLGRRACRGHLSTSALLGSVVTVDARAARERVVSRGPRWPAGVLIAVAALLALRWLSEIVPDLLAGGPSRSASTW